MNTKGADRPIMDQELEELWKDGLSPREWEALKSELTHMRVVQPSASLRAELKEINNIPVKSYSFVGNWTQIVNAGLVAALIFLVVRQYPSQQVLPPQEIVYVGDEFGELAEQVAYVLNVQDYSADEDIFDRDLIELERLLWEKSELA